MRTHGLTYEEHDRGAAYETRGRTVTEADVCAFVNLCGFNEPLFYDMEFVQSSSVFKGRPAPGAFTTSSGFTASRIGTRQTCGVLGS